MSSASHTYGTRSRTALSRAGSSRKTGNERESDLAPDLGESQLRVAEGTLVADQTSLGHDVPGSFPDPRHRNVETSRPVLNDNDISLHVRFENPDQSTPRRLLERSQSLDSFTRTSEEYKDERSSTLDKGKTTDPMNWGNVDISKSELDVNTQRALIDKANEEKNLKSSDDPETVSEESDQFEMIDQTGTTSPIDTGDEDKTDPEYEIRKENLKNEFRRKLKLLQDKRTRKPARSPKRNRNPSLEPMSEEVGHMIHKAAGKHRVESRNTAKRKSRCSGIEFLKPSNQLPQNSFIGRRLHQKCSISKSEASERSEEYDNDTDSFDSESQGSSDDPGDGGRIMHQYDRRKPKYKEIAPTKPAMFNGEANILKFHRYMSQCERYLDEGNVPKYDRVAKCSDFLEGKAYKYYSTEVSFNEEQWSTERFFQGLFNYCFPPDFKLKQCERLERFNQSDC
ncbi:hypothetical protein Agabi119p4_9649 [Agaricus bisporus var. burnettii]|uniref:Uncharacterized protein n=1 Tax=Agaricus bisporus var. burnettii TaxID=192524 RepID=A0A8H7C382_AGABI|nr:hypothetical protein Agabi119p4_9649 [Agaricus bisporus var. burnettii]